MLLTDIEILLMHHLFTNRFIGAKYVPKQRLMRMVPARHRGEVSQALSSLGKKLLVEEHKKDCWSLSPTFGVRLAQELEKQGEFHRVTIPEPEIRHKKPIYQIFPVGAGWKGRFNILSVEPTDDADLPLFSRPMFRQRVTASLSCPYCGSPESVFSFEVGSSDCFSEMDVWCSLCRLPVYHCLKDLTVLGTWSRQEAEAMSRLFETLRTPDDLRALSQRFAGRKQPESGRRAK